MTTSLTQQHAHQLSEAESHRLWQLSTLAVGTAQASASALPGLLLDLPRAVRGALLDFAEGNAGNADSGFFLLRGVTLGDLPDTPAVHHSGTLDGHPTDGTLTLVADLLGSLVGYQEEKDGALIHDVHPVRGEERRIENSGSVAFDFHTENAHHPLRPDYLGLLCVRQDHERTAATRVASVRRAVRHLTAEQLAILRTPQFYTSYAASFTRGSTLPVPRSGPHPAIFGPHDRPFMRFHSHTTHAAGAEATAALKALAEALEAVCHDVVLEPGELVVVDNHVAAHGRSGFTPRYDGRDRWLRRFYSLRSVPGWARHMMPRQRVLPALEDIQGVL
ncbi:TauD/TfdA family dioxygenase [Streptomyces sp. MST-110588]|uniref:TauD/TfdA family dioxygenase n=1 Tax=Streptomyces sp. MST-110588 TaxID=2833628 RepID=UPI001F5D4C6E|nr:TauD/TfdA family dioxygenase [Streptomyces sp. MST-110588]UNO43545.1 TauD/TfdA family dioxygenase [Streptomyces sp. MST-110588]